eukprot:1156960-Pelagomonas_calceolata.AAC.6
MKWRMELSLCMHQPVQKHTRALFVKCVWQEMGQGMADDGNGKRGERQMMGMADIKAGIGTENGKKSHDKPASHDTCQR